MVTRSVLGSDISTLNHCKSLILLLKLLEASSGIEPEYADLQSAA